MTDLQVKTIVSAFGYLHHTGKPYRFEELLEGSGLSQGYINRIKLISINLKILKKKGNKVEYREGLCKPSEKMIRNLLENEVRPTTLYAFSDASIIRELIKRGYKIEKV